MSETTASLATQGLRSTIINYSIYIISGDSVDFGCSVLNIDSLTLAKFGQRFVFVPRPNTSASPPRWRGPSRGARHRRPRAGRDAE